MRVAGFGCDVAILLPIVIPRTTWMNSKIALSAALAGAPSEDESIRELSIVSPELAGIDTGLSFRSVCAAVIPRVGYRVLGIVSGPKKFGSLMLSVAKPLR